MKLRSKAIALSVGLTMLLGGFVPFAQASAASAAPVSADHVTAAWCGDRNHLRVSIGEGRVGEPTESAWAKLTLRRDTCKVWVRVVVQCSFDSYVPYWLYGGKVRIVGEVSPVLCRANARTGNAYISDDRWQWWNGQHWINKSF